MISVIIPVYNVEKYLEKCLRSVLTNTYRDLEVICVNDGSPDGGFGILQKMQAEDSRVVVIDQVNQGVQKARNNGIKAANGEYIAFIDSDDWIHPQYFQTLLHCMEKTGADMAICQGRKISEEDIFEIEHFDHIHYRRLSDEQFNKSYYARHMVWGRLFRRQDIDNIWFKPEVRSSDDTLFNLSVVSGLKDPVIYETDAALYFYLQRANSIVHSLATDKLVDFSTWYVMNKADRDKQLAGPWSWVLLLQAVKFVLSYRYEVSIKEDKEAVGKSNELLRIMMADLIRGKGISLKNKAVHIGMFFLPFAYRQYRLRDDPTLRIWEQKVKEECMERAV